MFLAGRVKITKVFLMAHQGYPYGPLAKVGFGFSADSGLLINGFHFRNSAGAGKEVISREIFPGETKHPPGFFL